MSFRNTFTLCNILKQNLKSTAFRPGIQRSPINQRTQECFQSHLKRSYTTSPQSLSKITGMISSPEPIKATKIEPKVSKLKELSKKYGVVGVLVYLGVGVVDLGIIFGVIQLIGLEKVKALEKSALDIIRSTGEKIGVNTPEATEKLEPIKKDEVPSFTSVFILAYSIHKTLLLPVRLGITAAIIPTIVRKIHQLGWTRYFPKLLGAAPIK